MQNDIANLDPSETRARFFISGKVDSQKFPGWIEHYAGRLGLQGRVSAVRPGEVEVIVSGPPDLLDALEIGCSLGPIEVLVDHVRRESLPG
ncbi:acylphosphatase [Rubellimicrobium rubrum]|uniref:acylphosphatase n=1 Tax=Rubellimicrobium rubrum TaxID=2585369 RepID=UPI00159BDD77|nr:acylphosphatase [Rubellimicrobium rubrum]